MCVATVYHATSTHAERCNVMRSAWLVVLLLPGALVASTAIATYSQISGYVPTLPSWGWAAIELSLAAGIVWLCTRTAWTWGSWRDVLVACGEGWMLLSFAIGVTMAFGMLSFHPVVHWQALWAAGAVAVPLALWCMAEEVVLRRLLPQVMPIAHPWLRYIVLWGIAVALVWLMSTPASWFALAVIAAGEGFALVTAAVGRSFTTWWARRWAWRWLMICIFGATQLGISIAVPSVVTLVIPEALVPAVVTMSALIAWGVVSLIPPATPSP